MATTRFTLGKNERLKSRKLVGAVFTEGKKINQAPFRVQYLLFEQPEKDAVLQVGIGVSTKHFKRSVDRNRVRRLIREAWRLNKDGVKDFIPPGKLLAVFIIYTGREMIDIIQAETGIKKLIKKLAGLLQVKS